MIQVINLAMPQIENDRRGLNTKRGMRQAKREGRWAGTPPKGYSFDRSSGKSLLVPNEDAKYIQEAFEMYGKGVYYLEEVRRHMSSKGYYCSKSNFPKVMRNPVYIGKIYIEAWKEDEAELVDGLHESIIDEALFYKVQELLKRRSKQGQKKNKINENLPLRGLLQCRQCGRNLSGGPVRNKAGKKYYYYNCQRKYGCKENFSAKEANMQFIKYLESFQITEEVLNLYYHVMKDLFKKDDQQREKEKRQLELQIEECKKLIEKAEDKFINDEMDRETYSKSKSRYQNKIDTIQVKLQEIDLQDTNFMNYVEYDFALLYHLKDYYLQADTITKQKIVSSLFPEKLIYEDKKYRTPKVNEVLSILTNNINELGEIKKGKNPNSENLSLRASPRGLEPLLQG
ncbi:recombinase family protein [bacterium]|nr:recombinase family protein [bacterium]